MVIGWAIAAVYLIEGWVGLEIFNVCEMKDYVDCVE